MQQVTINGSVHEDSSIISQQPVQPQYITEPTSQEQQYQQESEQDSVSQSQQQPQVSKIDPHSAVIEEVHEQQQQQQDVGQNYSSSAPEAESEHQISSQNTNTGPKTYATLVKSFPNVGSTSPQVPKPSITPVNKIYML